MKVSSYVLVLTTLTSTLSSVFYPSTNEARHWSPWGGYNDGYNDGYNGGYNGGYYGGCREGAMFCDYYSGGFYTCAQGRYVLRQCGPGTRCQQQGQDNVFCNYA